MKTSFYSQEELDELGFKACGKDVRISRNAQIYSPERIALGNHVRIDDFCILSGSVTMGNYIHISAYAAIFAGDAGVVVGNYAAISSRVAVYAVSDDYSGDAMTNPTVPDALRKTEEGTVTIAEHVIIGSGCTVLPGVTLHCGAAVGAMSLVNKDLAEWGIYAGIPCKLKKDRNRAPLELAKKLD